MKIESLKDLKALIKLCRQQGVDTITVDGVTLELGTEPQPKARQVKPKGQYVPSDMLVDQENQLTEEQLLFYSSEGLSEQ